MKDFSDDLFSSGFESSAYKGKGGTAMTTTTTPTKYTPMCYESHPRLKLANGEFIGGSCGNPVEEHANVYVGLDHSMSMHSTWPWLPQPKNMPVDVYYPITDYQAPKDAKSFKMMVTWLCNQLQEGKTVHVGCIGGHGRTGTVLSAVVAQLEKLGLIDLKSYKGNAIGWVRKHYCKKAVESSTQVDFLHKYFGCKKVAGAKSAYVGGYSGTGNYGYGYGGGSTTTNSSYGNQSVAAVKSNRCIYEVFEAKTLA